MNKFFLDTNIIIDFLAKREPFAIAAAQLFHYAEEGRISLFVSSTSYTNLYYILRPLISKKQTLKLLDELFDLTETVEVSKTVIQNSLKSDFSDFEDAVQYHCALQISKLDAIITRNGKDFKKSILPVFTAEEALSLVDDQ